MNKTKIVKVRVARILRTDGYRIKQLTNAVDIEVNNVRYGVGDSLSRDNLNQVNEWPEYEVTVI